MRKATIFKSVLTAVLLTVLMSVPDTGKVYAEGSWENVTTDGIIYQCVTDTESDIYGKAFVSDVTDEFKNSKTTADIKSAVDYGGKSYPVIAVGFSTYAPFSDCTKLTAVSIPNSVLSIGSGTFRKCESLQSITIPDSVTNIEGQAFIDCIALSSVKLPSGLKALKEQTFYGCKALKSIEIPASVESIEGAFNEELETVTFQAGSKLTSLKDAFTFSNVKTIVLPDSVTTIGQYSFSGCKELTSITLPSSLKTIGEAAFRACPKLTAIVIPDGTTTIGAEAFNSYVEDKQSGLASITIPKSVSSIADNAFNSNNPITIYGYTGSEAEKYAAKKSNITFIALDAEQKIKNAYFEITIPASWTGKYEMENITEKNFAYVAFYSKKCYAETKQQAGWLFSIAAFTDDSYKEYPSYSVIKKSGGQTYVFIDPTDVQFEGTSDSAKAEYSSLFKDAKNICDSLKPVSAPKAPTIKSVKNIKSKKAKITLKKKISGAKGYEYSYSTSKKFNSAKSKSNTKTSLTLKKLKKNKTYYVRVRTYTLASGKKVYSAWSKTKSVKIKK